MFSKIFLFSLFVIFTVDSKSIHYKAGGVCSDPLANNPNISPFIKDLVSEGGNFPKIWPIAVQRAISHPEEFPSIAWDLKNNITSVSQENNSFCGECDIVYAYTRHDIDLFGFVNTYLSCSGPNYDSTFLPGRKFVESFKNILEKALVPHLHSFHHKSKCIHGIAKPKSKYLYRSQAKFIPFEFVDGIFTNYMFFSTSEDPKAGAMLYYTKDKKYFFVMKINKHTVAQRLKCSAYPHESETLLGYGQKWRNITKESQAEVDRVVEAFKSQNKEVTREDIVVLENVH